MDRDEIEQIGRTVLEDRKREKAPMTERTPLVFCNPRAPRSAAELDPAEQRQAVAVGRDGVGLTLSPDEVFGDDAADEGLSHPEVWDVVDAEGALAYRVWMYGTDNGTVLRRDTIEIVAGCSQGGLESADRALVAELIAARKRIPADQMPEGSCIRFLG
jgi:hypothetical protein